MHYQAMVVIIIHSIVQGCALSPPVDPERRATAIASMSRIYECVWYEYLNGDEPASNELIDRAIEVGKQSGVRELEVMSVYSDARAAQKEEVNRQAIEYAQKTRPPLVENIMGNPTVIPTEQETTKILLDLYRDQCENL